MTLPVSDNKQHVSNMYGEELDVADLSMPQLLQVAGSVAGVHDLQQHETLKASEILRNGDRLRSWASSFRPGPLAGIAVLFDDRCP
jgi:hypothetical protein